MLTIRRILRAVPISSFALRNTPPPPPLPPAAGRRGRKRARKEAAPLAAAKGPARRPEVARSADLYRSARLRFINMQMPAAASFRWRPAEGRRRRLPENMTTKWADARARKFASAAATRARRPNGTANKRRANERPTSEGATGERASDAAVACNMINCHKLLMSLAGGDSTRPPRR